MFKNRIRTAAIAGIAALATGVTGTVVATPAFAQVNDGSESVVANPDYTPDYDLAASLAAVNEYIQGYALPTQGADYDNSEEGIAAAVAAELVKAEAQLEQAVSNELTAREAALEAEKRWNAVVDAAKAVDAVVAENSNVLTDRNTEYVDPATGRVASVNQEVQGYNSIGDEIVINDSASLFETINRYADFVNAEATPGSAPRLTNTPIDYDRYQDDSAENLRGNNGRTDGAWTGNEFHYDNEYNNPTDIVAAAQLADLNALQDEIAAALENASVPEGNWTEANGRAFNAYYDGLEELQGQVNAAIADLEDANKDLFDAKRASSESERAQALRNLADSTDQRNVLRRIVAQLEASVNFYNLHDKDALVAGENNRSVREVYETAITAITDEINADKLRLNDGEQNVPATSPLFYQLQRAGLLDQKTIDQGVADDLESEKNQAIIDHLKPSDDDETPAPTDPALSAGLSSVDAELSSGENAGLFGIVAVIAAILAAIGLAIPALGITLPF